MSNPIETTVHTAAATHAVLHSADGLLWCDRIEIDLAAQSATLFNDGAAVITIRFTETVVPRQNLSIQFRGGFRAEIT